MRSSGFFPKKKPLRTLSPTVRKLWFCSRLTRRAIRDLRHIYQFIRAETSATAHDWFRGLEAEILSLETLPARGSLARERPKLRHLYGTKPHIYRILYATDERAQVVNVVQIRHGARRPLRPRK